MRFGILFTEDESLKLENICDYLETDDVKSVLTKAINAMYNVILEGESDD